jgi:hypothetical protein
MINFAQNHFMSRGRDRKLIDRRDAMLLRRYFFWTEVKRVRFDDALRKLSEDEFFISEERILRIIREKYDTFSDNLAASNPKPMQLSLFTEA